MQAAGRRRALIIATERYADPKLKQLRTPSSDAESLARALRNPSIGNFSVDLSLDETEAVVRRKLSTFFADAQREDLLLLHVACHGVKDDDGELYFATSDTETRNLFATAVRADDVERLMSRSLSRRIVLLLDCCYSGAFGRGMRPRGDDSVQVLERFQGSGRGRAVLTASSAMEYAWEGEQDVSGEGLPSVFTGAIVRGLETGEADRDGDGKISVDELYDYVLEQVREATPKQTPNKMIQMEGGLIIADSVRGARPAPDKLPLELREAVRSPLAGVREGIVSELAALLDADDPTVSSAAAALLGRLAGDDSRRVAVAAKRALAGDAEPPPASEAEAAEPQPEPRPTPFREVRPQLLLRLPLVFGVWVCAAAAVWAVDWVLYNQSVDEAARRLAEMAIAGTLAGLITAVVVSYPAEWRSRRVVARMAVLAVAGGLGSSLVPNEAYDADTINIFITVSVAVCLFAGLASVWWFDRPYSIAYAVFVSLLAGIGAYLGQRFVLVFPPDWWWLVCLAEGGVIVGALFAWRSILR
jgi:uncharacterized caspase-like protein